MSKNIVLLSLLTVLAGACGGEVTTETGETTGGTTGGAGGGAQAGAAGTPGTGGVSASGQGGTVAGQAGTSGTAGTGGTGGSGGAQAGSGGVGGATGCTSDAGCPQSDNGTEGYCVNGQCQYVPLDPCMGKQCGDVCTTCKPGQGCPPVVEACNAQGQCVTSVPECGGNPTTCQTDKDCPVDDGCFLCADGTEACPTATCEKGLCQAHSPVCPAECKEASDCPQPKGPCKVCPDDTESCPTATCTNGQCGLAYLPPCAGTVSCAAQKATGMGSCKKLIGYIWNGSTCNTTIVGCTCEGPDCGAVYPTTASCEKDHAACPTNPCAGKKCGSPCSTCPDGQACPAIAEFCDIDGGCKAEPPACD